MYVCTGVRVYIVYVTTRYIVLNTENLRALVMVNLDSAFLQSFAQTCGGGLEKRGYLLRSLHWIVKRSVIGNLIIIAVIRKMSY